MMAKISVLGLGAMGSRMAANLLKAGHAVTVWNRTPAAADALVAAGATQAANPKVAAGGADFVIAMVRDDEASRSVWLTPETGALSGMTEGSIAIESSTLTPGWIRELGSAFAQGSHAFLEAPVAGSRPQAEAGQLVYLVGGDEVVLNAAETVLRSMGSGVRHVGPLGSGATVKLATNALLGVQVTALAELIGLLSKSGIDARRAIDAIASTAAWSPAATYLSNTMLAENFTPQFPIELIEKDFGYVIGEASSADAVPTLVAAREVFRQAIERGFGADNMTGVVRLFK
ncbi:NAD(P)-dependent oxidoreductase [Phyllobacterium sp. SB3]|uniref:NAD(P)-dependent oxidoreductase n=1 Tax=Phyllobacterium sp. SB3 TaxID=3156073 RepID=UPI0032AF521A